MSISQGTGVRPTTGASITYVNHANPIHDSFCRCRACKPSLVGEQSTTLVRFRVVAALSPVIVGLAYAARVLL